MIRHPAGWVLAAGLVLTACADAPPEPSGAQVAGAPEESADACAERVVPHRYGETRIEGVPRRIVPVTIRDQDLLLSFGHLPVAIQDGYYRDPYWAWPWVPQELRTSGPEVLPAERLNFEQVAALRPDLILGAASGMSEEEYRVLSRIAPTVAHPGSHMDYGVPWDELTRTIGSVLCLAEQAEALVAETEALFEAVRARHPDLAGKVGVVAMPGGPDGAHWAYGPDDARGRLLARLGMELPPELAELTRDHFVAVISRERMDLFDHDLIVWLATEAQRAELARDPVYRELDVVRRDGVVYLDSQSALVAGLTNPTPLNLPWVMEQLLPRLVKASDMSSPTS